MTEAPVKINPKALASAIGSATVDPATRKVRIGDALFTPEEVKALANIASAVAYAADTAVVHRAGDVFMDYSRVFISDGVVLHRVGGPPAQAKTHEEWVRAGYESMTLVTVGPDKTSLGDVIRDAIKASL